MIEAGTHSGGDVEVGGYSGEEPFGDVAELVLVCWERQTRASKARSAGCGR
ncbi:MULTISPECIES: hypothetical protein [Rhodococcus]|uniref:hypothetical protein n=1 Tax=Rhodococcus TaxID=1827 RepID=UPI0008160D6F|nr:MULTISPECIES: hypothetical protein [Rhodococcus]SCC64292.1 hypothetical protein GA0061093_117109 [Rhodococcus qingshengii]